MVSFALEDAGPQLSHLIEEAGKGEEVVILQNGVPIARLMLLPYEKPARKLGTATGMVQIADDFDAPLDDFAEYQ